MQLSQYISDLLFRYECVVVPDFGAFLTQSIPAFIEAQTNTFYPPKKRLSFNVQLSNNDGVLANHIADVEQLTYEQALAKIAKQVLDIKTRLEDKEPVNLAKIGVFQMFDGKLHFEPSYELNYLTEAFGLSQFVSPEISRKSHMSIVSSNEGKESKQLAVKNRNFESILKYAAVAVITLGLGAYLGSNAYLDQIEQHNVLAQEQANIALDHKIQEATFVVSTPLPSITLNVDKPSENYHIVAGAFRIKTNSERKLRQLKRLGFNARIIGQNRYGLHQVVYDSYNTREEAQQMLFNIKKTQDPTAWLLVKSLP